MNEAMSESAPLEIEYYEARRTLGNASGARHEGVIEFSLVTRGTGLYLIGNRTYEADEGDIIFITEGIIHKRIEGDDTQERRGIICPTHYIPNDIKEMLRELGPVIREPNSLEAITSLMNKLRQETLTQGMFSEELVRCYVNEMAIALLREENCYFTESTVSPAVAVALSYLREHFQERITLVDAAEAADVSVAYLSRRFKSDVGVGFAEYLSRERLERAARMLREQPEMSITEIAFSSGFNDSNYFSDKFKREFGISPLKFRKER